MKVDQKLPPTPIPSPQGGRGGASLSPHRLMPRPKPSALQPAPGALRLPHPSMWEGWGVGANRPDCTYRRAA
jgi:hypothetical protein